MTQTSQNAVTPTPAPRRINERLLEYWNQLRGDRPFPDEADVDPSEIADIWESCFLVRCGDLTERGYKYTYLGLSLIEAYGDDVSNHDVCSTLIEPTNPSLVEHLREVMKTGKPLTVESEFINLKKIVIKYRSCLLPLGDGRGGVEFVIGGMKWKGF